MPRSLSLKPLRGIQTTKRKKSFEVEDDHEQPMSPLSRLLHEPGSNVYIIVVLGMKTPINLDVFKRNGVHVIYENHRFSSLQVLDKESGSMKWVPTHVNIDNHIIVPELDANMKSSDKFVEDYISNLSGSRVDSSMPLWDLHILNTKASLSQGTCVFRFHQSLGDGISLMKLLLTCSRKASDLDAHPTFPMGKVSSSHIKVTNSSRSIFTILWNSIVAIVMFFLTVLFLKDTKTPLKGSPGVEDRSRRFVLTSVGLDDIKMVKNAMDVTLNDVVVGVLQAALYRYLHRRYGAEGSNNNIPKNILLRAMIPINMRTSSKNNAFSNTDDHVESGNKIGSVSLPLSIKHRKDPLDNVREAKKAMDCKKASLEPLWTSFIANSIIKLFGFKIAGKLNHTLYSNVTLCFSNVPGPQDEISFLGHEVVYLDPSCYGVSTALMIHVISYVDKVIFVVSVDEVTIPDPQNICDDLQQYIFPSHQDICFRWKM